MSKQKSDNLETEASVEDYLANEIKEKVHVPIFLAWMLAQYKHDPKFLKEFVTYLEKHDVKLIPQNPSKRKVFNKGYKNG